MVSPAATPGSIPAGAGEPWCGGDEPGVREVYPRGCGGTGMAGAGGNMDAGLSPRVRGNRSTDPYIRRSIRSIPAGAGEPQGL